MWKNYEYILQSPIINWLLAFIFEGNEAFIKVIGFIVIIFILIFFPVSDYTSKSRSRDALLNWLSALIILLFFGHSIEMIINWYYAPEELTLTQPAAFLCLTLIAIGIGGIFSISAFRIYVKNNSSYEFNKSLIEYNLGEIEKGSKKEINDNERRIQVLRNIDLGMPSNFIYLNDDENIDPSLTNNNLTKKNSRFIRFEVLNEPKGFIILKSTIIDNGEYQNINYFLIVKNSENEIIEEFNFYILHPYENTNVAKEYFTQIFSQNPPSSELLILIINFLVLNETEIKKDLSKYTDKNKKTMYLWDFYFNNLLELISLKHNYLMPISFYAKVNHLIIGLYKFYILSFYISWVVNHLHSPKG